MDSPGYICLFVLDSVSAKSTFQQGSCQQIIIFSLVTKILHKVHTEAKSMTVKMYSGYLSLQLLLKHISPAGTDALRLITTASTEPKYVKA